MQNAFGQSGNYLRFFFKQKEIEEKKTLYHLRPSTPLHYWSLFCDPLPKYDWYSFLTALFEIYELLELFASIPREGCRERMEKVFHLVATHFQFLTTSVLSNWILGVCFHLVHDSDHLMFISLPCYQVGSGNILAILPSSLVSGCQSPYISRREHNLNIRQLSFGYMGVPVMAAAVVVAHSVNWSQ